MISSGASRCEASQCGRSRISGYVLARGRIIEAYFFENPVSEAEVRRVADLFGLDWKH